MEKLTCPVCGLELTGLEAACPRCTFPNISSVSGSEEEKQALEKLVVEFRRRYWSNAKISLNVYTNRLTDDGEVEVAQTEQITLAKAGGQWKIVGMQQTTVLVEADNTEDQELPTELLMP